MTSLFSRLFNSDKQGLSEKKIYDKIELYAQLLLNADKNTVSDEQWRQTSDFSASIILPLLVPFPHQNYKRPPTSPAQAKAWFPTCRREHFKF